MTGTVDHERGSMMNMNDKVPFKVIISSSAYREIGKNYYKSMQFFVALALLYNFIFNSKNLDLLSFIFLSVIWSTFGISLLIAMPFFGCHALLVSRGYKQFSDKFLWLGHICAVFATFYLFYKINA